MTARRAGSDVRWNVAGTAASIIATVLLAVSIGVAVTRPAESLATAPVAPIVAPTPKKIVVVGDSFTEGTMQGGFGENGWAPLSWRQLGKEGAELVPDVVANGGSGYVTRGPSNMTFADELRVSMAPDDDVVVVFGGSNDIAVPPADLTDAVREALTTVREKAPQAKLVVVGPVWPNAEPVPEILRVRDILRDEASALDATFVDPIADQWFVAEPQLIGDDEIHPTTPGHVYMSERLLPVLRSALTPQPSAGG